MKNKYTLETFALYFMLLFPLPFIGIIAVICNHFMHKQASESIRSHLLFQWYTFWSLLIVLLSALFILLCSAVLTNLLNWHPLLLIDKLLEASCLMLSTFMPLWFIIRMIKGAYLLLRNKPIPSPKSWLLGG